MTSFPRKSTFVAILLVCLSAVAAAQDDRSRVMGSVTDGSGGALPGVTVTVRSGNAAPISVITDGSGHYLTSWIPPGTYTITFILSGFETGTVKSVRLDPGQTVVLDQQLSLAALSETVEVTAPAPAPPAKNLRPARPEAKPVDKEILASVCGPRQATDFSQAIGHVVSQRDDSNRQLMGPGDILRIDAGEKQGVTTGTNFVVRRRFQTGDLSAPKKLATFAEQTAGLIQIVETQGDSASALVVYVCGELYAGDSVEPYIPQPAFFAVSAGSPRFDEPAKITTGENGRTAASGGQMMVIDRGIMQGVQRGQRLTIFRRPASIDGVPVTIGDGVIIAVRADSATMRIDRVTDAVMVGDLVALHR
ncbi:MAG TPA: carboxypeptidase-like regulatory domain-containing protein [Vicinamibacterales bacterium]|nr:carboxypeptidase-like regulatory domain-containing protein [Vicinamibacterales bacterium]